MQQQFHRGDQVALRHGIKDPNGDRVPMGTPGVVQDIWPIFDRKRGGPSEYRYTVAFTLAGREVPSCFVDEAALELALLGGLFD